MHFSQKLLPLLFICRIYSVPTHARLQVELIQAFYSAVYT